MTDDEVDKMTLEERVVAFQSLSLPGQPMAMHMGTSYLVNDLWREVQRQRELLRKARHILGTYKHGAVREWLQEYREVNNESNN